MFGEILDLGLWRLASFFATLYLLKVVAQKFFSVYLSPMSNIPGPKLAAASDLWLLWHLYGFRKCPTINNCFEEYGDIVRIGPNKVALNTPDDIKVVYGIGTKFVKSPWYKTWSLLGADNVFTIDDPREHAERRRITAKLMSKNSVVLYLNDINEHIRGFLKICAKTSGTSFNILTVYRYLALDVVGSAAFGKSFDLMKTGKDHPFADDLDACVMAIPPRGYLPKWLWWLVKKIPSEEWQFNLGGEKRMCAYGDEIINEKLAMAQKNGGEMLPSDSNTLIGKYLEHRDINNQPLPRDVITGEIGTIYFAGTDTTSNTLTFTTWEIASNPQIQAKLFAELEEKLIEPDAVPPLEDVETWPYLNAVIKEGLRKYAAAPSHLERVVPSGGVTLQGKYLPSGTIVGVQAYSIHRKRSVFPDPEAFIPERWLNETEEMRKHFIPFGLGSRVCMGQHIALLEIRLVLATLVRQYELLLPKDHDPSSMECKDFWLVFPAGKKLDIMLKPRKFAAV